MLIDESSMLETKLLNLTLVLYKMTGIWGSGHCISIVVGLWSEACFVDLLDTLITYISLLVVPI